MYEQDQMNSHGDAAANDISIIRSDLHDVQLPLDLLFEFMFSILIIQRDYLLKHEYSLKTHFGWKLVLKTYPRFMLILKP